MVAVIGIVLIIAGGSYALYERYVVGGIRLSKLAFNPIVDAFGIVGLALLVVGIAMYYRMKAPQTTSPATQSTSSSSAQNPPSGSTGQKSGQGSSSNKKNNPTKS